MSTMMQHLRKACKNRIFTIALPEGTDSRILQASKFLLKETQHARVIFYQDRKIIEPLLRSFNLEELIDHRRIEYRNETETPDHFLAALESRVPASKGLSSILKNPKLLALHYAGHDLEASKVNCALAGATNTTADVIRTALRWVGKAHTDEGLSGAFLMDRDDQQYIFTDCGVTIRPDDADYLSSSSQAIALWKQIPNLNAIDPRIAFLSFSTKGSANHILAKKMADAAERFQKKFPQIKSDGELQFDAAIDPKIAARKTPNSPLEGRANIFVFPDLNSANLAYKIAQRLGGFDAYGPILLGFGKVFSDLSRGATVQDCEASIYISALRSFS